MRFEWDEQKRRTNLIRHGLDFGDVKLAFEQETVTLRDERYDYGETRFITLSVLEGVVVAIVHTETDELIRVISFRMATAREERSYYETIRN